MGGKLIDTSDISSYHHFTHMYLSVATVRTLLLSCSSHNPHLYDSHTANTGNTRLRACVGRATSGHTGPMASKGCKRNKNGRLSLACIAILISSYPKRDCPSYHDRSMGHWVSAKSSLVFEDVQRYSDEVGRDCSVAPMQP